MISNKFITILKHYEESESFNLFNMQELLRLLKFKGFIAFKLNFTL